jgi:hypothetical protein
VHPGAPEACNDLDDDCDGETDEGNPGGGGACGTGEPGVCAAGTLTCRNGAPVCLRDQGPSPEAAAAWEDRTATDGGRRPPPTART